MEGLIFVLCRVFLSLRFLHRFLIVFGRILGSSWGALGNPHRSFLTSKFCAFLRVVPRAVQERPRAAQERPRAAQERPRAALERPKSGQESPKRAQEHPRSAPRAPKSRSRDPKKLPRRSQEAPGDPQEAFKKLQHSQREPQEGAKPACATILVVVPLSFSLSLSCLLSNSDNQRRSHKSAASAVRPLQ